MRNWFDCYTKSFLQDMLGPTGKVETQHEIRATDSQWADVWYEPDAAQAHLRERMGWLGKMCAEACTFEPFGRSPEDEQVRACLRKLFTKHHQRIREAIKKKAPTPPLPRQWTIAPSLPPRTAATFALRRPKGWPKGISFGPDGYGLGWVSLRDLPRTRQTLLLRLMGGSGPVFRNALEDLENLPGDAWERPHAKEMLVARRAEFGQDPSSLGEAEQEFLMSTQPLVQQWKEQIRQEARQEGLLEGQREGHREGRKEARQELAERLRTSLLETYRARFGSVPPAIANAIQLVRAPDKLASWVAVFATKSSREIAGALKIARNDSQ
jgi:hypothetical protein